VTPRATRLFFSLPLLALERFSTWEGLPREQKGDVSGHFGFAGHSDPVAFRSIQIKSLEPQK